MQVGQASAAQQSAAAEPVAQARPLTAAKSTAVSRAAYHDLTKRYAHHTAEMLWKDLVQDLKLHSACWASACMYKCQKHHANASKLCEATDCSRSSLVFMKTSKDHGQTLLNGRSICILPLRTVCCHDTACNCDLLWRHKSCHDLSSIAEKVSIIVLHGL